MSRSQFGSGLKMRHYQNILPLKCGACVMFNTELKNKGPHFTHNGNVIELVNFQICVQNGQGKPKPFKTYCCINSSIYQL